MAVTIDTSDVIASLALLASLIALWQNHRTNQRQKPLLDLQIQKEKEELRLKSKADIQARYFNVGTSKKRLKVSNVGLASARNVKLTFDEEAGVPLSQDDVDSKFPLDVFEPKHSVELIVFAHFQTPRKHLIHVEWDDDSNTGNSKEIILTL